MALGTIVGGEIGRQESKRDRRKEREYLQKIIDYWQNMDSPTEGDLTVDMKDYDPAILEQFAGIDGTAHDQISLDPSTRNAQMQALSYMQNLGQEGGMDSVDRARMAQILGEADTRSRGARGAIKQDMQQRGVSGSGLEMVQQQMANQQASQNAYLGGVNTAAEAQRRALQAMQGAGQMGGQIRGQDYQIQSGRANAMDAINKFNSGQRQDMLTRNVDRQNQVNVGNTDMGNKQTVMNRDAKQKVFDNALARGGGMSAAYGGMADRYKQQGQDTERLRTGQGRANDEAFYNAADMVSSFYGGGNNKKS